MQSDWQTAIPEYAYENMKIGSDSSKNLRLFLPWMLMCMQKNQHGKTNNSGDITDKTISCFYWDHFGPNKFWQTWRLYKDVAHHKGINLREFHKLQYLVYYRKSLIFAALVSLFAQIRQTRKQALIISCCP